MVYLDDNEVAILTGNKYETKTIQNIPTYKKVEEVLWNIDMIEKGGYPHFMLKEIHEQPQALRNAMRGRVDISGNSIRLGGLIGREKILCEARRIVIVACGTSWHAGLVGEYMLEELARIPVEVEYASEFRYRNPVIEEGTIVIAISQSGETADTLGAMREAKHKGRENPLNLQRRWQHHRKRIGFWRLFTHRPGNWRCFNKGIYCPDSSPVFIHPSHD